MESLYFLNTILLSSPVENWLAPVNLILSYFPAEIVEYSFDPPCRVYKDCKEKNFQNIGCLYTKERLSSLRFWINKSNHIFYLIKRQI